MTRSNSLLKYVDLCGYVSVSTGVSADKSRKSCNLNHMIQVSTNAQAPNAPDANPFGAEVIVTGVPVVGGLAYGRIVKPGARPGFGDIDATEIAES